MDRWELIAQLVDAALAEDPGSTSDRVLRALLAFTGGHWAAMFEVHFEGLRLVASRGIDEQVLNKAHEVWHTQRSELVAGSPVFTDGAVACPLADQRFLGMLLVERTPKVTFEDPRDLQALREFGRLGARTLRDRRSEPSSYLARTAPDEVARDQLLVLLETNEWNIARVARLLGVTRPTVYARLQRFGLPRLRARIGKRQPA